MSNEQPSRPRKSGSSASPMGSTLAIVIAIAAVVVGFLILRNITSNDDEGDGTAATTPQTTPSVDSISSDTIASLVPTEPTTTVFQPTTAGAKVLVANSSHQNGVAKTLTTALQGNQFTTAEPANGATKEAVTKIQYLEGDAAAQQVAQSVAGLMGVAAIEIIPTPVQLQDPTLLADATVLVLLGDDKAGKTLAQMTGAAAETTTPAAGSTVTT